MKNTVYTLLAAAAILGSCVPMDIAPKSQGSSASWYTTETELKMAVNEFYILGYWNYLESSERWTDNNTYRNINYNTPILDGTVTGETWDCYHIWEQCYKLISRTNSLLDNISRAENAGMNQEKVNRFKAEACFARACKYGDLIFLFGDVPYIDHYQTIEEAEQNGRVDKATILQKVYDDFDFAAQHLPASYAGSEAVHFTKGAAYAMKARYALYMGDWATAAAAASECMKLGYTLENDYSTIFLQGTKMISEKIFVIPRSISASVVLDEWYVKNSLPRNAGGYAAYTPSWDLLAAYLCTDGLPIDESPLFNSQNPFANRDPRCTKTIVEFGTAHMGYIFDPSPNATKTTKLADLTQVSNQDSRAVNQYASFNGLLLKKGIDESWLENFPKNEKDYVLMRYADVLLMYAEAKIELGEIDASVLNAINTVRARAYGVKVGDTAYYPAVTGTDQATLRKAVRIERRMELAYEQLRYADLIRWRLAAKVLNLSNYINLDPAACKSEVVDKGYWFWGMTPSIDEDGVADFSALFAAGLCQKGAQRVFPDRQYLMPIPTHDIELSGGNLKNNEGY